MDWAIAENRTNNIQIDLSHIDFDIKIKNGYTLIEYCILKSKYINIKNEWFQQNKNKYNLKKFF